MVVSMVWRTRPRCCQPRWRLRCLRATCARVPTALPPRLLPPGGLVRASGRASKPVSPRDISVETARGPLMSAFHRRASDMVCNSGSCMLWTCLSRGPLSRACIPQACIRVHLMSVHPMGVSLIGVYVMVVPLMGVHVTGDQSPSLLILASLYRG